LVSNDEREKDGKKLIGFSLAVLILLVFGMFMFVYDGTAVIFIVIHPMYFTASCHAEIKPEVTKSNLKLLEVNQAQVTLLRTYREDLKFFVRAIDGATNSLQQFDAEGGISDECIVTNSACGYYEKQIALIYADDVDDEIAMAEWWMQKDDTETHISAIVRSLQDACGENKDRLLQSV
jgi:hypothetical protein